jgi:hypothetical protein
MMTKKETLEFARLRERVALLEGLIEQVVQLHYPERWRALELQSKRSKLLSAMAVARAND